MSIQLNGTGGDAEEHPVDVGALASALRSPRRRTALAILTEAGKPLGVDELASRVAERERTTPADVRSSLHHRHLPVLAEAGLVVRGPDDVAATGRAVDVDRTLPADDDTWEALATLHVSARRRAALDVLAGRDEPVGTRTLAEAVVAREGPVASHPGESIRRMETSLHHTDLPALADADLVEFDPETGRAAPGDVGLVDRFSF